MEHYRRVIGLFNRFQDLVLYGIFGSISASVDFMLFYLLTYYLNVFYVAANMISVSIAITLSFNLNRRYNFKAKDRYFLRYFIFMIVGFGGLFLSTSILYYLIDILLLNKIIAKLLSIALVVFIQFFINKSITFKKQLL